MKEQFSPVIKEFYRCPRTQAAFNSQVKAKQEKTRTEKNGSFNELKWLSRIFLPLLSPVINPKAKQAMPGSRVRRVRSQIIQSKFSPISFPR